MASDYSTGNIVVIEGLESVRRRPGMYIGGTDARGLQHMAMESIGNSLDQVLAGHARSLRVDLDSHGWLTVEDDGRGISVEPMNELPFMELIFTHLSMLPTVDGHHPHVHVTPRLHGVGVGVVSALSARLEVDSHTNGQHWRAAFERGVCVQHAALVGPTPHHGTRVRMLPDKQIFEGRKIDAETLRMRMGELAYLLPALRIRFQGAELTKPSGLRSWLLEHAPDTAPETLRTYDGMVGDVHVEVALGWSPTRTTALHDSFVNLSRTELGGTHVAALLAALEQSAPSPDLWNATKNGFASLLHVGLLHPRFGGPTKAMLASDEATPAVKRAVSEVLASSFWDAVRTARASRA